MKRIRFALLSAAVLLVSFGSGVIADDLYKTIKVSIKPVSIIVDDTGVVPSDRGGYFNNGEKLCSRHAPIRGHDVHSVEAGF